MKFSKMSFLYEGNTIPRTHLQHQGHLAITFKNKIPQKICDSLGLVGYYRKFIKNFAKITKTINTPNVPAGKI